MDYEEAKKIGRKIMEAACDDAFQKLGIRPHVEDRGNELVIVWPDGEESNSLEIEIIN